MQNLKWKDFILKEYNIFRRLKKDGISIQSPLILGGDIFTQNQY